MFISYCCLFYIHIHYVKHCVNVKGVIQEKSYSSNCIIIRIIFCLVSVSSGFCLTDLASWFDLVSVIGGLCNNVDMNPDDSLK